jgi:hypothetical protein
MVPPTIAVSRFSLAHAWTVGVVVASKGVPVETAVATTSATGLVAVGVCNWRVALNVVVTFGAFALSQQLFVSSAPRQQYSPESHVWSCQAFTGLRPLESSETVVD